MRLPTSFREEIREEEPQLRREDAGRSAGTGRVRKVLIGAALIGLGYLAWKRTRSGVPVPWADEEPDEHWSDDDSEVSGGEPIGERIDDESLDETAASVDPTLEEVDERVEEDVDEEPAEPGEMTVSEEVAEEAGEGEPEEGSDTATDQESDTADADQEPDEDQEE